MARNEPVAYEPAKWDVADVAAIQACMGGTATPEQQKRVLDWIVLRAAATDDVEYRQDARDHAFTSGRRFVGLQIRKLMAINTGAFSKNGEHNAGLSKGLLSSGERV